MLAQALGLVNEKVPFFFFGDMVGNGSFQESQLAVGDPPSRGMQGNIRKQRCKNLNKKSEGWRFPRGKTANGVFFVS